MDNKYKYIAVAAIGCAFFIGLFSLGIVEAMNKCDTAAIER